MTCVRRWINQPSTLQPLHKYHGTNVLVDLSENLPHNLVHIYFLRGNTVSLVAGKETLSKGWRCE